MDVRFSRARNHTNRSERRAVDGHGLGAQCRGWMAVDDEVVVYDVRAQACHVFEGVAALAWQCLDGDGSIDDILTDFADIFEVDLELVRQDLVPLFTDWFEKELIVENQND